MLTYIMERDLVEVDTYLDLFRDHFTKCSRVLARAFRHCRKLTLRSPDVKCRIEQWARKTHWVAHKSQLKTQLASLAVRCRRQLSWHQLLLHPHRVTQEVCTAAPNHDSAQCSDLKG